MAFSQDVVATMGVDTKPFQKGLGSARQAVKRFAGFAAGAIAAIGFKRLGDRLLSFADDLKTAASTAQVSVEFLQEFQFAAEQVGVSSTKATKGLEAFAKRAGEAAQGTGRAVGAFKRLGISLEDDNGRLKGTEQLLREVANGFAEMEDGTQKATTAADLFSRSGQSLVNVLDQGEKGLRKFAQEANVVDQEDIETLDAVDKKIKALQDTGLKWAASLASEVLPTVEKVFKGIKNAIEVATGPLQILTAFIGARMGGAGLKESFEVASKEAKDLAGQAKNIFNVESELAKKIQEELDAQEKQRKVAEDRLDIGKDLDAIQDKAKDRAEAQEKREEAINDALRERQSLQNKIARKQRERLQFGSVSELAQSNLRAAQFFGAPQQFFEDVQASRRVSALEQQAQRAKSVGRLDIAQQRLSRADEIRGGILALQRSERRPFDQLKRQVEQLDVQIRALQSIDQSVRPLRTASTAE